MMPTSHACHPITVRELRQEREQLNLNRYGHETHR